MVEPVFSLCQHCRSTDPNHGRCIFEDLLPEDADGQPHHLVNDGPTLGGAARWTCSACGKAVLRFGDSRHPYGSAWHDPVCRNR